MMQSWMLLRRNLLFFWHLTLLLSWERIRSILKLPLKNTFCIHFSFDASAVGIITGPLFLVTPESFSRSMNKVNWRNEMRFNNQFLFKFREYNWYSFWWIYHNFIKQTVWKRPTHNKRQNTTLDSPYYKEFIF
jgi:hypothetical protein